MYVGGGIEPKLSLCMLLPEVAKDNVTEMVKKRARTVVPRAVKYE